MAGPEQDRTPVDIVVYGDAPYDFQLWTNRQHVATVLAASDPAVRVLYVEAPSWFVDRVRGRQYDARPFTGRRAGPHLFEIADRLWVHRLELPLPTRVAYGRAWPLSRALAVRQVRSSMRRLGFGRPVLWTYGPAGGLLVGALHERLLCYDVVDDYAVTSHVHRQGPRVLALDAELTERCDLLFAASEAVATARPKRHGRTVSAGNAADVDLFRTALEGSHPRPSGVPEDRPVVVFHGRIDRRLDGPLLRSLLERMPDVHFVFVGPGDPQLLDELRAPNATQPGFLAPADLVPYLAHATVGLIPYADDEQNRSSNALKIREYLAAGLPVVATDLPCFAAEEGAVWLARGPDGFDTAIRTAAGARSTDADRRRTAMVEGFSWRAKAARLVGEIRSALAGG